MKRLNVLVPEVCIQSRKDFLCWTSIESLDGITPKRINFRLTLSEMLSGHYTSRCLLEL